jgi:hypothetical protein
MIYLPPNPENDHARRVNAEITRAQLRIQMARLRKSTGHWYRWLTGRTPAER